MSVVICRLPKAGLGNQLFPLLKAYIFSEINQLPVIVTGYKQFFIGPYLRGEKSKRKYNGLFVFQKNILVEKLASWKLPRYKNYREIREPAIEQLSTAAPPNTSYLFSEMPHWDHYFDGLKENRERVIRILQDLLRTEIKEAVEILQAPIIGIHVRMGDFRKLQAGEQYGQAGAVRAPEEYFISLIEQIRKIHGSQLPVKVFTDGYRHELTGLLKMENIEMVEGNRDMVDLLLLSKSRIIITSAGSTFSYWAGFLSDAAVIMHPGHIHSSLRPAGFNEQHYEGAFDITNELLVRSIKSI